MTAGGGFVCFGGRRGCVPFRAGAPRGAEPAPAPRPVPPPAPPRAAAPRALRDEIAALTERLPPEVPLRTGELVPRAAAVAAQLAWAGDHPGKLARALASVRALAGPPPPPAPAAPYEPPPASWDAVREACDRLGAEHAGAAFAGWVGAVQKRARTLAEAAALATALADADEHYRARLRECRTAEAAAEVLKTASKDPRVALDKGELARLRAAGFGWGEVGEASWPRATDEERAGIRGEGRDLRAAFDAFDREVQDGMRKAREP